MILNCFERSSKAFTVFLSAVFCEIIVAINVSNGFFVDVSRFGTLNAARNVFRSFCACSSAILVASPFLKTINTECVKLLISNGVSQMERARVVKDEIIEQNIRFLAVYVEAKNSCLVLLSENEDKLGTMAIAVPKPQDLLGPPSSSVLLGDKNGISARMFAEYVASKKEKIAVVSIYLETLSELQAQSIFKKLIEKVVRSESEKEGATA